MKIEVIISSSREVTKISTNAEKYEKTRSYDILMFDVNNHGFWMRPTLNDFACHRLIFSLFHVLYVSITNYTYVFNQNNIHRVEPKLIRFRVNDNDNVM